MAKLIITRSSEYMNLSRKFRIYLNGQKIGTISSGETKEFVIPEGKHNLCAKIDWCGSQNFPISENKEDIKSLSISGFKYGSLFLFLAVFLTTMGVLISHETRFHFIIWFFLIPVLFVLTYNLTIGRNRYLVIKEISKKKE